MVAEPVEEMPSISGFDFWGATVVPGKTVKCEITGNILHLTSVAMDENIVNDPKQRSVLSVIIDGKQFVLASLREGVCEQIAVDFLFRENKPIKFKVSGKTTLHLVGYLQPLDLGFDDEEIYSDEEDEEDEMCGSCEDEDSEEAESDEEDDEMETEEEAGGKKRPADIPVEKSVEEKAAKKSKKGDATAEPKKTESKPEPKKVESKQPEPKNNESKSEPMKIDSESKEQSEDKKVESEPAKPAQVEKKQSEEPAEKPQPKKAEKESKKPEAAENPQSKKAEKESKKAEKKNELPEAQKAEEPKKEPEAKADPNAFRKLHGGVMVKDTHIGEGKVAARGKRLGVMYKGMLKSGKVFDSNVNSNKPFFFKMGNGDVIKGWDVGFEGMKVGGKRVIVCPPKMAYGKEGAPPEIPPNSVLVFEVELVNVK